MNFDQAKVHSLAVHYIGNKAHEETLSLSTDTVDISDEVLQRSLLQFFSPTHFKTFEQYNFAFTNGQLLHNPVYAATSGIFAAPDQLLPYSVELARHLYQESTHPNIKSGELYVALIRDVLVQDELTDCLAIFKAELESGFLQPEKTETGYRLNTAEGTSIGKIDKGCLIFNADQDIGFQVLIADNVSRGIEAKYWRDQFLYVNPADDEYAQTRHVMGMTQSFVNEQMPLEFGVEPKKRLEYLDKSLDYFKNVDHYSEEDFADAVFDDLDVSSAFDNYKQNYQSRNDVHLSPSFDLSEQAVKKQAGKFRSVIKLDRNFHIYVHGDRTLIENGTDEKGRRFYKLYYQTES